MATLDEAKKQHKELGKTIRAAEKLEIRPWYVVASLPEVAEFFEVSSQTVYGWRAKGCPGEPHKWDVREIARWYYTEYNARPRNAVQGDLSLSAQLTLAEIRLKQANAELRERENLIQRGKYMLLDDASRQVSEMANHAADLFQRIPETMATRFPVDLREQLVGDMRAEIDRTLTVMAEWRPTVKTEEAEEEETETTVL